jgi:hypothetical protein
VHSFCSFLAGELHQRKHASTELLLHRQQCRAPFTAQTETVPLCLAPEPLSIALSWDAKAFACANSLLFHPTKLVLLRSVSHRAAQAIAARCERHLWRTPLANDDFTLDSGRRLAAAKRQRVAVPLDFMSWLAAS